MQPPENIASIAINEYNYLLPDERIARYPLEDRSACRLLQYNNGVISSHCFREITSLLPNNSLVIRNNTQVIKARIHMQKATGASIEILCLEPHQPSQYECSLASTNTCLWQCMIGNARKWKEETLKRVLITNDGDTVVFCVEKTGQKDILQFSWDNPNYTFGQLLEYVGILPIPPYLHRETEERDNQDYQTVYARNKGSVAAPTAGLHFTNEEFEGIAKRGIPVTDVTLHVGAGTFLPVKTDEIGGHTMHKEVCIVRKETLALLLKGYHPIIAIGTTTVRTLESLYYLGKNHLDELTNNSLETEIPIIGQWEPYNDFGNQEYDAKILLQRLWDKMEELDLEELVFATTLLIVPNYRFQIVSGLITNFHQPKSTLLLIISALMGDDWQRFYQYALENDYRFLSYGDACLIYPRQ